MDINRRIAVAIPGHIMFDTNLWESAVFNKNVLGSRDSSIGAFKVFYISHPTFPVIPVWENCRVYSYKDARRKFPYLFTDTNPLLWRQFGSVIFYLHY